jgi:hypothetical protein
MYEQGRETSFQAAARAGKVLAFCLLCLTSSRNKIFVSDRKYVWEWLVASRRLQDIRSDIRTNGIRERFIWQRQERCTYDSLVLNVKSASGLELGDRQ